jgi:hypothetical protein
MRLSKVSALLVSCLAGSALVGLMAMSATGCDGGTTSTTSAGGDGGSATGGGGSGGTAAACAPACDANADVKSDCIAIVDNAGQANYALRMAQLTLEKPAALTNPVVAGLIESGVTMNLKDCNLTGDGTFSWLLQFDTAGGKLKTGGAKPVADPTAGYCFVNEMLGGITVAPLTVDATPDADGKFSVMVGGDVVVPIFLAADASSYVLLPLKNAKILNATVSADLNCMGKYNSDKLLPEDSCEPAGDVQRFTDAATLDGHITLEDADGVIVSSLGQSLCVLLTGDAGDGGSPKKCSRDPATQEIIAKGDWCSATDVADDCQDAFKLGATFAASAVKVSGDCPAP